MSKRLLSLLVLAWMAASATPLSAQSTTQHATYLNVELTEIGKQLQFQQAARLTDVLKQAKQQNLSLQYSIATTLFDNSKKARLDSNALKNSVLKQMMQYNLTKHPFYQYIQKQQFAPRLLSAIDIDSVRLDIFNDPLLRGDLILISPMREEKVIYLGDLGQLYSTKAQAGIPLQKQIKNLKHDLGELAKAPVLIYPNGNVALPHLGSWLTTQYYLPPLTMVYIPFNEYKTSKMDQDIVQLLTQLKPTVMMDPL